jgi:2-deoxy-D-gluconate 3-dehydrogenase
MGKSAIVTGGAMGIGKGIATRLAEAGAAVVLADMDDAAAQATAAEFTAKGWKATAIQTNVADEASVQAMVQATVQAFGGIDILVNNAGIYPNEPFASMTFAEFQKVLGVNLNGVFLCTRATSTQMIAQGRGGKIINITSIDALHPSEVGLAHYDASKHGVWGFTKNIAIELAEHKIWVNAIAPGGVATPGVSKASSSSSTMTPDQQKRMLDDFLAKIPMHRMGEPDDIGKVALFLASDLASYMTGSQVVVDGGALHCQGRRKTS